MSDFQAIPINGTAEQLEKLLGMDIVDSITENSSDDQIPTAKSVYNAMGSAFGSVSYNPQELTPEQQAQVRKNIGAVQKTEYGIKIDGVLSDGIEIESIDEKTESGFNKSTLRFLGYEDGAVMLKNVADGVENSDAATVGQVKEMLKNADGSSEEAYLYTSFTAAVADLNASTTENADATEENAVCAIYTDSDGNNRLLLISDIELTETVEFTVPVIFDLNNHKLEIIGDYRIDLNADNIVIDGRAGNGQIIKNTGINTVSYCINCKGNNLQLLGGYYSIKAPADTKLVAPIYTSGDKLLIDGAEIHTEATSGIKSAYGIVGKNKISVLNSTVSCKSLSGNAYGVYCQSKNETAFIANSEISAISESEDANILVYSLSGHKVYAEKSKIQAKSIGCDAVGVIASNEATIANCDLNIDSVSGGGQCLYVNSGCTAIVENSTFFADGTTGSVAEGNEEYAGTQGIINSGRLTIKNCNVYGTHTGMQCNESSITKINGGLFEGPGHGGIYIANGTGGQFYAENCTVKNSPYRGKYKDKFFYGNSQYMVAAVYIGGGNGIKAYFDNCIMDGGGPERIPDYNLDGTLKGYIGAEPIRFRQSSGEQNNSAYISNCTLMGDGKIRFANATHSLHLGFYNRILCEPSLESCMVDEGRVVYTGYEEFRTV